MQLRLSQAEGDVSVARVVIGVTDLAVDGTGDAVACRHHQHTLDGMGQESDGAADLLHDGHKVRWGDRLKARPPPATRPPALGDPTAVSDRPRCACRLFHGPSEWRKGRR